VSPLFGALTQRVNDEIAEAAFTLLSRQPQTKMSNRALTASFTELCSVMAASLPKLLA